MRVEFEAEGGCRACRRAVREQLDVAHGPQKVGALPYSSASAVNVRDAAPRFPVEPLSDGILAPDLQIDLLLPAESTFRSAPIVVGSLTPRRALRVLTAGVAAATGFGAGVGETDWDSFEAG